MLHGCKAQAREFPFSSFLILPEKYTNDIFRILSLLLCQAVRLRFNTPLRRGRSGILYPAHNGVIVSSSLENCSMEEIAL
jgi:hypothetical protein